MIEPEEAILKRIYSRLEYNDKVWLMALIDELRQEYIIADRDKKFVEGLWKNRQTPRYEAETPARLDDA